MNRFVKYSGRAGLGPALLVCGFLVGGLWLPEQARAETQVIVGKVSVIDADTWKVGGVRVRLFGIDAPEGDQPCAAPDGTDRTCGAWATAETRALFEGRTARCRVESQDRYGRAVARCAVAGQDAGRVLVAEGIAFAYRRYSQAYDLEEKAAAIHRRGVHRVDVDTPEAYRARGRSETPVAGRSGQVPGGGCDIKGNINAKGARIYHLPGQADYAATRISEARGERWFCSEEEARAAGWRRARR